MKRSALTSIALTSCLLFSVVPVCSAGTIEAKVLESFKVANATGGAIDDYHILVEHFGPGNLNFTKGEFGRLFGDKQKITADDVSGNGTPKVAIDIDIAIPNASSLVMKLEFVQKKNAVKVTESFWTIKDIEGNPVRVPANQNGNAAVPGFEVKGDPVYTILNDFDVSLGIRDLRFLFDVPEIPFDEINPGEMSGPGWSLPVADFVLGPGDSRSFDIMGMLSPENFLYAQGLIFDGNFQTESGAFLQGHQQSPIPEPSTFTLLGIGATFMAYRFWRKRK